MKNGQVSRNLTPDPYIDDSLFGKNDRRGPEVETSQRFPDRSDRSRKEKEKTDCHPTKGVSENKKIKIKNKKKEHRAVESLGKTLYGGLVL